MLPALTHQFGNQSHELSFLYLPRVRLMDLLAPPDDVSYFCGISKDILDLPRQVRGIAQLEEYKCILVEIIRNAPRSWRNHGLSQRQILKNPYWCVELRKNAHLIGNDSHITRFYGSHDVFKLLRAVILNTMLKLLLADRFHHLIKKRVLLTINS